MSKLNVRRLVDIVIGSLGLTIFSPLILIMIVIARIESGKSGIFRQIRYGLHGNPFTIYKIRNLDDRLDPLPVAGQLRKIGFDELPQLVNLLKGDMSLIGPRPHSGIPNIDGWKRTLEILPGLTGINGVIEKETGVEHSPEQRAEIESRYIDTRKSYKTALQADIYICFKTAQIIFKRRADAGKYDAPLGTKQNRTKHLRKLGY